MTAIGNSDKKLCHTDTQNNNKLIIIIIIIIRVLIL
jgi:hypothetical protein